MLFVWFIRLLLCISILFAVRKGDEPERMAAIILVAAFLFDVANHMIFGAPTWFEVNPGHFVIDTWAFLTLTWVALKANRGWPLFMSASQLSPVMAHFSKLFEMDVARRSYWVMTQTPAVAQMIVLIIGTYAHVVRQRRIGAYAPWLPV